MADLSWLWAALIGVGGAVGGGMVSGRYVLRAGQRQWERDREDARAGRSHQAATSIADALGILEEAVFDWTKEPTNTIVLYSVFNDFARTAIVQGMRLSDDALRRRVEKHKEVATFVGDRLG
jgi:hypothetical protein